MSPVTSVREDVWGWVVSAGLALYPVLEIANNRDSQETVTALETIISHMRMSQSLQRQQNGYQDSNREVIGRLTR